MNSFCILPWIHLATRPNGDVRVCCTSNASGAISNLKEIGLIKNNGINMNLRTHSIEDVWNSEQMRTTRLQMLNGEIPPSCQKCFIEEKNGIVSKRQWETKVWSKRLDVESIVDQTTDDGNLPVVIPYFDLRLGNTCQLKCIMCSPHDSSSWIKDWKLQYFNYTNDDLKKDQNWDSTYDYTWYQKNSFLESIKNQAKYIKELYFAGGEPLLIPEHYRILEFMVENGFSSECVLRYNSNGLEISDNLFSLWNKFKMVKFNFSIDAVGNRNEYIRYPTKWEEVERNLYKLDNTPDHITVNIACAVQVLNILHLPDFVNWKISKNFKKINRDNGAGLIGTHLVYLPNYLNVRVLPIQIKEIAKDKIENFIGLQKNNDTFISDPYGKDRWNGLIKYMMEEDWSSKIPALKQYLTICDQTRKTNYIKTFPELKDI